MPATGRWLPYTCTSCTPCTPCTPFTRTIIVVVGRGVSAQRRVLHATRTSHTQQCSETVSALPVLSDDAQAAADATAAAEQRAAQVSGIHVGRGLLAKRRLAAMGSYLPGPCGPGGVSAVPRGVGSLNHALPTVSGRITVVSVNMCLARARPTCMFSCSRSWSTTSGNWSPRVVGLPRDRSPSRNAETSHR